ncbi:MAG: tRNA adenosine(34) deaminase TadA [candidate division Zixibacteria bacterium]|nr:tRNA adenosine(34) deaminase TadA [candidate division Zixibacteria bacterium]
MDDAFWMNRAIIEAQNALDEDEVPVGCVIVHNNRIIGRGYNQIESLQDPTAHAEIIAITAAAEHLGSRRLEGCALYVTLEPCVMCCGAMVLARIDRLVFGARDPKAGAALTLYNIPADTRLNHRIEIVEGIYADECGNMLSEFFRRLRTNKTVN